MNIKKYLSSFALIFLLTMSSSPLLAQDPPGGEQPETFSRTELHLLFNLGPLVLNQVNDQGQRLTVTLDHFSTWRYGSNYFFLDTQGGPNFDCYTREYSLYLEYTPALSINKIFRLDFGPDSPLREISVAGQINIGAASEYRIRRVWLEGFILDWNIPGFTVLSTQFYVRHELDYRPSWQVTVVWNIPIQIGPARWEFRGFFDIWQRIKDAEGTEDAFVLLAQPQLLLNLDFLKLQELFIGMELQVTTAFPSKEVYAGKRTSWDVMISPMVMLRF